MKYLVIAEKPSVSKSIAKVIGAYRQEDGYLEGGDCVVSWCLGHLAEYAAPEHYDERYESWRFEDLPILPVEWKLLVHNTKKPQFNVLRKLLRSKKFDYVVNACDAGREGEAIFRRVYALAGSKLPIRRLWISSMEDAAIQPANPAGQRTDNILRCVNRHTDDIHVLFLVWDTHAPNNEAAVLMQQMIKQLNRIRVFNYNAYQGYSCFHALLLISCI